MTRQQRTALEHPVVVVEEAAHPRYAAETPLGMVIVTVDAGAHEAEFGGPVWHASAQGATAATSEAMARAALHVVGAAVLGEWTDRHGVVAHVRRRLSEHERWIDRRRRLELRDVTGSREERDRVESTTVAVGDKWIGRT